MKKAALALIFLGCFGGCVSVPFEPVAFTPLGHRDAETLRGEFAARLADSFEVIESAVIDYRGHHFTAISYTKADGQTRTFKAAALSPQGLKLFELEDDAKELRSGIYLPQIDESVDRGKIAEALAEDIRRIYLDRIPSPKADVQEAEDRVFFRVPAGDGVLEYVLGGPERAVVEKNFQTQGRVQWRVFYPEYREKNGKLYPQLIHYENTQFHYRVTLRLKEVEA